MQKQSDKSEILHVSRLSVHYHDQKSVVRAVDDVSFSVKKGQTLAVVGESGCGKSTLALSLFRLLPPAGQLVSGQILLHGQDLATKSEKYMQAIRGKEIGLILQDALSALNPVLRIGTQIAELYQHHFRDDRRNAKRKALDMLAKVSLPNVERTYTLYPHQLSGGQRQRVAIALALACKPKLLVADEPTTALDVSLQNGILALLSNLQQEMGLAVLLISHDLGVVAQMADQIAVMYAGRIVEQGPSADVFQLPVHPYTKMLLEAMPRILPGQGFKKTYRISGQNHEVPDLRNLPAGCAFAPRCPLRLPACSDILPTETAIRSNHIVRCLQSGQNQ